VSSIPAPQSPKILRSSGEIPVAGERYGPDSVVGDKYRLVRKLGEGGMGSVWVARQTVLDMHCAIKLVELGATGASHALAVRLFDEARAAAQLEHAAIVRVFDFGETSFGDPFVAMELLDGDDLAELLQREGRIEPSYAVQALLPIIHALATAHAKGIVHRDIKPENIFLARDASLGIQPKLLDFGVVHMIDRPRKLTSDGVVVGTPDYMSPEQARGQDTTGQTDQWSLAVVLCEVITGQRPCSGPNYNALMRAIIEHEPPTLLELRRADRGLSVIVERALRKRPADRWPGMRELGEELARWLAAQGITEDACGTSLRRTWLAPTESQRLVLTRPAGEEPELPVEAPPTEPDLARVPGAWRRELASVLLLFVLFALLGSLIGGLNISSH
jgi:eukaryotic-like serine/threonine-protein kinase